MKTDYLFLLGGKDLEMQEIKRILDRENLKYLDAGLDWNNANWEFYLNDIVNQKEIALAIKEGKTIIGIELQGKKPKGESYRIIDHHNNLQNEPSSLEQVAQYLGINLTRDQELIAANDKGYIPAMESFGSTNEEIITIRAADRKAQGVTSDEEELAEKAIKNNRTEESGVTVVKSPIDKFSPIADRLYGKTNNNLIIYSENELNYYGRYKEVLVKNYQTLIEEEKAYHGGGNEGFFGIASGYFRKEDIYNFKDDIINLIKAN